MKFASKILLAAPLALLAACTNSSTAGSTTETENAIAKDEGGTVSIQVFSGASKAGKTSYKILPSWFVTDSTGNIRPEDYAYIGETDNLGKIHIENHKEGSYTIQLEKGDSAAVFQYTLNSLTKNFTLSKANLRKRGSLKGWITLPEGETHAWVNIEGIGRVQKTDSLGFFQVDSLPAGWLSVRSWSADNSECIAEANASVPSGDTIHIGHVLSPAKKDYIHSMKFTPADLVSDWMRPLSVPYVLVLRLDSTNFKFSEANSDGSDLRLYASNGAEVEMEIDGWDPTIKSATINVRLESLKDTSDTWTLEWGNTDSEQKLSKNIWEGISDSLWYDLNTVELFHFDSGTIRSDLPAPLTRDNWYIQFHKKDSLTDSVTTSFLNSLSVLQSDTKGRPGKVMHIEYDVEYPDIVVFGTRLTRHPHDWSRMDSVVVWLRGDCEFEVILETLDEDLNYKASYKGEAQSGWQRLVLRPEDFTYKLRDYHGWDITRNKITNFTVFMYNGSNLWLDNVRVYGVNRDDLR